MRVTVPAALLVSFVALASASASLADEAPTFVLIVNSKNETTKLDKKTVADIFLKKQTHWSDDSTIKPVDQTKSAPVRARFSQDVLDRSVTSVRTYWNQVVFSGGGVPPPELDSDAGIVKYVIANPGAIGYVTRSADTKGIKIVEIR